MSQKESNLDLRFKAKFLVLAMREEKIKKKKKDRKTPDIFLPWKWCSFDLEGIEMNIEPHCYIIIMFKSKISF